MNTQYCKYIITLSILFTFLLSCKKSFLDVEDQSIVLRQQYIKDLESLNQYLNGTYIQLSQFFFEARNQAYSEVIADNIKPKPGGTQLRLVYSWDQLSTNNNSITFYNHNYKISKSCNFIIETADVIRNENPSKADHLKAQALALRALVNFITVNVYSQSYNFSENGSHPGIALTKKSDPFESITKRNSVSEVYTSVIADLAAAIPLFESGTHGTLLIGKKAAKALLSRVLLFKEDFVNAKNLAIEVLSETPLMSSPAYPVKLFTLEETEALLQLAPSSAAVVAGSYTTSFLGRYLQGTAAQIQFLATDTIASLLTRDPQDVRKSWITTVSGNHRISKFPSNVIPGYNPVTLSYYPTLLRSSEMCLIASECYAKLNMEDSAIYYLDLIRLRASPLASMTTETGALLLDKIYTERRKELSFEGLRMFDLLRWKWQINRGTDVTNGAPAILPYPSNDAVAPIPLADVQITGLQQNPGY